MLLVVCAVVLCAALGVALLLPAAQAYTSDSDLTSHTTTKIDEIFSETTGGFNKDTLQKLINALDGNSSSNLDLTEVEKLANTTRRITNPSATGGAQYGDVNGTPVSDKKIVVELGGIKWIVVYVSAANTSLDSSGTSINGNEAEDGNVILTLWQATATSDTIESAQWNEGADTTTGTNAKPYNMYGTSAIRAKTLNNGGYYITSSKTLSTSPATQSSDNPYAKFNMSAADGGSNIYDYLVAPRYLSWQYDQSRGKLWIGDSAKGYVNNESWGKFGSGAFHNSAYCYEGNDYYSDWKDDLVWLPSIVETGDNTRTGLWVTETEQRTSSGTNTWLRSAGSINYYSANSLTSAGVSYNRIASESLLVRPALHLNLTSAAAAANTVDKPTADREKTVVYNGQAQTFDLGIDTDIATQKLDITIKKNGSNLDSVTTTDQNGKQVLTVTEAGEYTVSVAPKDGYRWEGENSTLENPDQDPITFTFTIAKRNITLNVAIPSGADTIVYGATFNLQGASTYVSYPDGARDDSVYQAGATYKLLSNEFSQLKVSTPAASSASGALGVGKYPLFVEYKDAISAEHLRNYEITLSGNFSASGAVAGYEEHYGEAATVTVAKRKVVIDVKGSATLTYGDVFTMQDTTNYWSYASGTREDDAYYAGATYKFLPDDVSNLSVTIPNATSGTLLTPGTYDVKIEFTDEGGNYDFTSRGSATITVNNAKLDMSLLEAYYAEIANVEYRPNKSYTLSPDTGLITLKGSVTQIDVDLKVSASLSGLLQGGKYVVSDVGTYSLTVTVTAAYHDSETRTFTVTITKATPNVQYTTDRQTLIYTSKTLPEITATATIDGIAVPGTIRWTRSLGEVTGDSDNRFTWEFTPNDLTNYNVVTGDTTLNIRFVGVRAITYVFDPGDTIFYDTDDINELKNYLTVVVDFNDDTSRTLAMNEYTLTCQGGDTLVVGDVRVTISYLSAGVPVTRSFDVTVQKWQGPVDPDPTPDTDPEPTPDPNPGNKPFEEIHAWFERTNLPLGYAAIVLGAELFLIIILAIAARKPKNQ